MGNPTGTKDPDGIVVVRIPRRVSPFTAQARDWYFPQSADATAKDWDVEGWLKAFAGEKESVPGTAEVPGTTLALNKGEYNADAKEYRLTWVVGEKHWLMELLLQLLRWYTLRVTSYILLILCNS